MSKRWTATVTYRKTDDQNAKLVLEFDETEQLEALLGQSNVSIFNIVGGIDLQYNGHMGMPISMAQCFMDGDFEPVGAFH